MSDGTKPDSTDPYYARHVFFCCNQRDDARPSCNAKGASELRDYAKKRVKELGLAGAGKVRINQAGCLDRCEEGPVIVVYPEAVWYTYVDRSDIDEILEEHVRHGRVVERLQDLMRATTRRELVPGPAGRIECAVDVPDGHRGVALIAHPHPLFGGTLDNKVVQTLARSLVDLGYAAVRPNFRGVGGTEGVHDEGRGELEDMAAVLAWAQAQFGDAPPVLAGFSFGSFVQTHLAQRVAPERMVLVGVAVKRFDAQPVPANTLVIHGEADETVLLADVLDWARPQELPVVVVPGADHFFHQKLNVLRAIVQSNWRGR